MSCMHILEENNKWVFQFSNLLAISPCDLLLLRGWGVGPTIVPDNSGFHKTFKSYWIRNVLGVTQPNSYASSIISIHLLRFYLAILNIFLSKIQPWKPNKWYNSRDKTEKWYPIFRYTCKSSMTVGYASLRSMTAMPSGNFRIKTISWLLSFKSCLDCNKLKTQNIIFHEKGIIR